MAIRANPQPRLRGPGIQPSLVLPGHGSGRARSTGATQNPAVLPDQVLRPVYFASAGVHLSGFIQEGQHAS